MEPMLEVSGVTVRFGGVVALDGVDLSVPAGQVVGVIGPNGAGKTTLFNVMCGLVRPQAGKVTWKGRRLHNHRPHQLARLGVARTLQGLGLFPNLSVLENVVMGATTQARTGLVSALLALPRADSEEAALRERAIETLRDLGIGTLADKAVGAVDHGARKRVVLARAMLSRPELLLLDEPAAGLSERDIAELAALLPGLARSVVLVEHNMDFVMSVCHDVAVLDFGKLIARGTPDAIRGDSAVIAAYLGREADNSA
ncbi:ABC transporter ATP-binding protein [Streptacidiphilus rugosus]|uniref:ABC transporter ATP-binding protein n=1 Tax=Streptacidiphilus rugosus TaxID=405783 RepID=UPI00055AF7E2|nr:ABC transporter ATP-binding protein [Streptacidiphilus rugosus]